MNDESQNDQDQDEQGPEEAAPVLGKPGALERIADLEARVEALERVADGG